MAGSKRKKATAYHEAGHAVAAWRQGLKFKRVTIKPDADSLGHVLKGFPKWFRPDNDQSDRVRLHAERHIIMDFAGQLAEAKFRGRRPRYGMGADNQNAVDMALYLCGSQKAVEAFLRFCWCVSQEFVNGRWGKIEALAAALLERETLNYEDAIEVIAPGSKALRAILGEAMARKKGA